MVRRFARTRRSSLEPLALLIATLVAYYPAWHGGMLWDDNAHLTRPDLQSTAGLWRIWFDIGATQQYYPVTHSAFWLMHRLWGDATARLPPRQHRPARVVGLSRLRDPSPPRDSRRSARGGIFALHPVQVESVAWMTELKNTLSGVFYLAAALVYLRFDERRQSGDYVAALVLVHRSALLAKTVAAMLPAGAACRLLVEARNDRRGGATSRRWFRSSRRLARAGCVTAWFERALNGAQRHRVPARRSIDRAAHRRPRDLVLPVRRSCGRCRLSFIYPRWTIDATAWSQYLYPVAVARIARVCWLMRRSVARPAGQRCCSSAGRSFPRSASSTSIRSATRSSRITSSTSPASPFFTLLAASLRTAFERNAVLSRRAEAIICLAIGTPLGMLTWNQSHDYADEAHPLSSDARSAILAAGCATTTSRPRSFMDRRLTSTSAIGHLRESAADQSARCRSAQQHGRRVPAAGSV